jgi:hypothetical protein
MGKASLRQRSSVAAATPTCNETLPVESLYGGSNLATALSLNACSYRATSTPLKLLYSEVYSGDNKSDAGVGARQASCPMRYAAIACLS